MKVGNLTLAELEELIEASQEMLNSIQSAFQVMNAFAKEPYGPVDRPNTAVRCLAGAYARMASGYHRFEAAVPKETP